MRAKPFDPFLGAKPQHKIAADLPGRENLPTDLLRERRKDVRKARVKELKALETMMPWEISRYRGEPIAMWLAARICDGRVPASIGGAS